jgi:hypothetical protein
MKTEKKSENNIVFAASQGYVKVILWSPLGDSSLYSAYDMR